jgi:hypothetical protein
MPDVEMKTTDKKGSKKGGEKEENDKKVEPKQPPPTPMQEIKANIALIERAINDLESRYTYRVLRSFTSLRKRINDKVLRDAIDENYPKGVSHIHGFRSAAQMSLVQTLLSKLLFYHGFLPPLLQNSLWKSMLLLPHQRRILHLHQSQVLILYQKLRFTCACSSSIIFIPQRKHTLSL